MALNYKVIAQSTEEVRDLQNSPAISMGPYLAETGRTKLISVISVYSRRGDSREQLRLLYMNAEALKLWQEMGRPANIIDERHRPPKDSDLAFGVPYTE